MSKTAMHSSSPLELSLIGTLQAFMKGKESELARATGSTLSLSQAHVDTEPGAEEKVGLGVR